MCDITLCRDADCPRANRCVRFVTQSHDKWQSWFHESPRESKTDQCKCFWEVVNGAGRPVDGSANNA